MLDKILETSNYVYNNAKYVKIDLSEIKKVAQSINCQNLKHWLQNNPFGLLDLNVDDIINFLVIFDSIDCSFWGNPKWMVETKEGKIDGAFALMYCLLNLRKQKGHLNFEQISFEEFSEALKGNIDIPLLNERYVVLKNISEIINQRMDGNFYNYIKNVTSDIELFNIIINNFPSFEDTRNYNGKTIYFYKLAQLLVSDILHIREIKEKKCVDYSHLVGCADYKIPQVLRNLNIIQYNSDLANIVDNKKEIKENSMYEIEIRASMIVAIDLIKKEIGNVASININDAIWSLGQNKELVQKPYHLTRTMSY